MRSRYSRALRISSLEGCSFTASQRDPLQFAKLQFYEAIKNTRTVNFAIDGMNINDPASLQIDRITHQELDAIIQGGYLEKLHLWDGRTELTGQRLNQWIDIRGL